MTPNHRRLLSLVSAVVALIALLHTIPASAQDTATTVTGTVAGATRHTLTVNLGPGQYQVYTYALRAKKPVDTLPIGTQIRVVSTPGYEPDLRVAQEVTVIQNVAPTQGDINVPSQVTQLSEDIERSLKYFQFAVRGGVALDPELVMVGVHAQFGPFFRTGLSFRPGVEFGLGEVTAMVGFNFEMIYRLPFTQRTSRWSTYFGAGVGVNLIDQDFEDPSQRVNFGDFTTDTAMNLVGGVRNRSGLFLEMRTSVWSQPSPALRLYVGYQF